MEARNNSNRKKKSLFCFKLLLTFLCMVMLVSIISCISFAEDNKTPETFDPWEIEDLGVTAAATYTANGKSFPNSSVPTNGNNPWCECGVAVGSGNHGCCWNYAANAYKYIWGSSFSRYGSNLLRNIPADDRKLTANNLKKYLSVSTAGANLRIDSDSVATNGDNYGHSLVFLQMNSSGNGAFFLEGNYNGHGNTRLVEWSFDSLVSSYGGRYSYIKYIIWPSAPAYEPNKYLDLNGYIDGTSVDNIAEAGSADVYINGALDASQVIDYYKSWPSGTQYEIKNIRGFGYSFNGTQTGSLSGTIGSSNVSVALSFTKIPQSSSPVKTVTYNGHIYERYDYHLTWTEAKAFCESKGGHLVTITSAQEQAVVEELLSGCPFGMYYLGAADMNQSGNWSWVNGDPFVFNMWDPNGEPSKGNGEYYSAIIGIDNPPNKQTGEWIDNPNEVSDGFYGKQNCGFICEYEKTYTITYDANGGTGAPANQTKTEGVTLTLSNTIPEGSSIKFTFLGWALNRMATSPDYYPGDNYALDASITLYAVWSENWLLNYDPNGGANAPTAGLVSNGHSVYIDPGIPVYTGYRFLGWATNASSTEVEYQPGDSITLTQDTTLYAVWQKVYASDWSETRPDSMKDELIETKTQYRYSTKETTTSTSSSLEGWTLVDSVSILNTSGWSSWSTSSPPSNASQVETRTTYGWYYYLCPNCGAHMHGYGTNVCVKWGDGCGGSIPNNFHAEYLTTSWDGSVEWGVPGYYYKIIDGARWFKWADGGTKTEYRYKTQSWVTYYTFERWTEWSDWSDTPTEASDTINVETRTLYRYVIDEERIMTLPNGLMSIESEAFMNVGADAVIVPNSVRSIADDAFDAGTVLIGKAGSYAELFAGWNNLTFIPDEG